jgi:hypothetical protein
MDDDRNTAITRHMTPFSLSAIRSISLLLPLQFRCRPWAVYSSLLIVGSVRNTNVGHAVPQQGPNRAVNSHSYLLSLTNRELKKPLVISPLRYFTLNSGGRFPSVNFIRHILTLQ